MRIVLFLANVNGPLACWLASLGACGRADARQGVVRHQLGGAGRAWRLLSGRRRRHLQEVRPRRHHRSRRTERQQPHPDDLGEARLLHVGEFAADVRRGRQQHPDRRDRLDVPEGSAGPAGASGSQCEEAGGPEAADAVRLQGRHRQLFPVAEVRIRFRRKQGETLHLQPAAVPRRQEERDAGLCPSEPFAVEKAGGFKPTSCCSPITASTPIRR